MMFKQAPSDEWLAQNKDVDQPEVIGPLSAEDDQCPAPKCDICHREMLSMENCGGTCLYCMADAGDPECVKHVIEMARGHQ